MLRTLTGIGTGIGVRRTSCRFCYTCLSVSIGKTHQAAPGDTLQQTVFGEWLSLVEHLVRDQGVGGSNPLSPTILGFWPFCISDQRAFCK